MEKLWLSHYQQGVAAEINPDQYASLNDLFAQSFQKYADQIAFSCMGTDFTFRDLEKHVQDFATYLQQLNLAPGSRIAIMLPNLLQYPIVLLGVLKAGLVVVNTNPLYTANELKHQLNDSDAVAIIVFAQAVPVLHEALSAITALRQVIVTEIGDAFPFFKRHLLNFAMRIKSFRKSISLPNAISFRDALRQGHHGQLKPVISQPEDLAFLQYTGGTTGLSKGAKLSHRNLIANTLQASHWISPLHMGKNDIILTALPLYHVFSLTANCLVFFHLGVRNILIPDPRRTKSLLAQIHKTPPTAFAGVNTLFASLLNHPKFRTEDFSPLKIALSGGMALHESIAERWQASMGQPIIEAYGLTEASPAVSINPLDDPHQGSIGLPLPSTEISIRDSNGNECEIGTIGELCVRGPQVMQGYWKHPEETAQVFYADGFLRTGDSARVDENGFIYLVDRLKEMIIVSGFNVYPSEVETVIAQMDKVREVAVIGVPSKSGNERIKACVVKKDSSLTNEDIIAYCKKHLTSYKIPKIVEFYSELPKSNVGKILKRMLK